MSNTSTASELTAAIAALEGQRSILGDVVVDAALGPMRKQLDELAMANAAAAELDLDTVVAEILAERDAKVAGP